MSVSAREAEQGLEQRRRAEESRALAAEHRARAHELRAGVGVGAGGPGESDGDAYLHAGIEEVLAEVAELRAAGFEQRAVAREAVTEAESAEPGERDELIGRAGAALLRAAELEAQALALKETLQADADLHEALSEAAMARARAREQRSLAVAARAEIADQEGAQARRQIARAERHEAWAEVHDRLALAHRLRGEGLTQLAATAQREAEKLRASALAADERAIAAEQRDGPAAA